MLENFNVTVSIICSAYNHEKYIRTTIEGFLMQKTDFKFEVLIHDDASTDKTARIIREYEEKYPEIIKPIYQSENQYSKGIKVAKTYIYPKIKGEYVALCEGDDFWTDEDKLQTQVNFLKKHPEYVACAHAHKQIDMRDNSETEKHAFNYSGTVTASQIIQGDGNLFATNSTVYKKEAFLTNMIFRENSPVGDYPLMIQMAFLGKVYYIDKVMSCYRFMVPGSWSERNMINDEKLRSHNEEMQKMLEEADRYSDYKYHSDFKKVIDKKWFYYFSLNEKPSFLRKYYREQYNKLHLKRKIQIYLKNYAPFVLKIRIIIRKKFLL